MQILVPIALCCWIPIVLGIFSLLPARRAVIVSMLGGWLFLPMAGYELSGLPELNKPLITSVAVLLGAAMFDYRRFLSFRWHPFDLPMAVWCLCPLPSSVLNNLGIYDGLSSVATQVFSWGLPYFIGRLYFTDLPSMRELAVGVFVSGLIYVPLCLFEIRMSPQLCSMVYGFTPRPWNAVRFHGFRPNVFLESGLALGMWMTTTSLVGVWLWSCGTVRKLGGIPSAWSVPILVVTTVLCKATGALLLLVAGLSALFSTRSLGISLPVAGLILVPPAYITARATGVWDGMAAVDVVRSYVNDTRADSLAFRFENEDILLNKALQRPGFGWGGWGRNRAYDDEGNDLSIVDGRWIKTLGLFGWVGLIAFYTTLLLPTLVIWSRLSVKDWSRPDIAPLVGITLSVILFSIDRLMNGFSNVQFIFLVGGLTSMACHPVSKPLLGRVAATKTSSVIQHARKQLWPPPA